tara:strand:- start:1759 stop:2142 length:384 start_codon:yes stop_codon:yes gene_type:complete
MFRCEPHRGQVPENGSESPSSERWAVFQQARAGSYFSQDPRDFGPESRLLALDACASPGNADVGAWPACCDHVNTAFPSSSVKGPRVIPDRERVEASVVLSSHENVSGIGLDLDSADCAPSKQAASE